MPNDRLIRVRVRGYRCVADASFEPAERGATVLVGGNGSGKSSLLDAVGLVGDLVRSGATGFRRDLRGNAQDQAHDAFRYLVSSFGDGQIEVSLDFVAGGAEYRYTLALGPQDHHWGITAETLDRVGRRGGAAGPTERLVERTLAGARVRRSDGAVIKIVPVLAEAQVPSVTLGKDSLSHPELEVPRRFLRGLCVVRPTPVLMRGWGGIGEFPHPFGQDATARIVRIANEVPELRADFLRYMGGFVGWVSFKTPGASRVEFLEGDHPTPIAFEAASDGTVVEAWLLALALDPPESVSVLLIDEPAAQFFHRSLQRPAELLKALATQRQVVVATHATTLVTELGAPDAVWMITRASGAGTRAHRLTELPDAADDLVALPVGEVAELRGRELPETT